MGEAITLLAPEDPRTAKQGGQPLVLPPPAAAEHRAGSPEWWLLYLEACLSAQQRQIAKADRYYNGQQDTLFVAGKYRETFGALLSALVENWMPLVVDALRERMFVTGFRIPLPQNDQPPEDPAAGDADAWSMWQANDLDAESQLLHSEAFIKGRAFTLINPFVAEGEQPEITVEDASQMVAVYEAGGRRRVAAALKVWQDLYGQTLATLYLPEGTYKFTRSRAIGSDLVLPAGVSVNDWAPREVNAEQWPLPNPLEGRPVPVVPYENRPRLLSLGESEMAQVMSTQDAINKILADLMVASEFAAFPQRFLTGYKAEIDPLTGEKKAPFESYLNRILTAENENARFGQFTAAELANYTDAKKSFIESISARTRIPTHYFGLVGQWPSGEALGAAEAGLVSKALEKMLFLGNSHERTVRIGFLAMRDARGKVLDSETLWKNPERRSPVSDADAAVKRAQVGVTWRQNMVLLGFSPQEIERMRQERLSAGLPAEPVPLPLPAPAAGGG